jgi:hypothetical protein
MIAGVAATFSCNARRHGGRASICPKAALCSRAVDRLSDTGVALVVAFAIAMTALGRKIKSVITARFSLVGSSKTRRQVLAVSESRGASECAVSASPWKPTFLHRVSNLPNRG